MIKRFMKTGFLIFGMVALLQTQAMGGTSGWAVKSFTWSSGSLVFSSDWFLKNTNVWPLSWALTVCVDNVAVSFENKAGNTGGNPESANFLDFLNTVTGTGVIEPQNLVGKKQSVNASYIWGDCDTCSGGDGGLWYMFYDAAYNDYIKDYCTPGDEACEIQGIKAFLNWAAGEPNDWFVPYRADVHGFSAMLQAWTDDNDHDGYDDPAVYAEFANCSPDDVGTEFGYQIPTGTIYTCQTSIWEASRTSSTPTTPLIPGFSCGQPIDWNK